MGGDNDTELSEEILREDGWAIPMLVLCVATILTLSISAVCLHTPTMLSRVLVPGLLCCAVVSLLYTIPPSPCTCLATRAGTSIAYTLVYAMLCVRILGLISLHHSILLPSSYQLLILFFIIIIQVIIGIQWLLAASPVSSSISCTATIHQELQAHIYNIFLLIVLAILSLKFCLARPSQRETLFSILTIILSIIIRSIFALCWYLSPSHYKDLCSSACILATVWAVFSTVLLPSCDSLSG